MLHLKPIFDPPLKKLLKGTPISYGVWASKTWPFCGACKSFGAQHPLRAEIWFSKKVDFMSKHSRENAVQNGLKFTRLFPFNAGGNAGDNLVFLFLISPSISEIFELKVGRGLKLGQI